MSITITTNPNFPETVTWDFIGAWTWDEFSHAALVATPAVFKAEQMCQVNIILNMDAGLHPPLIGSFQFIRDVIQSHAQHIGQIYIVTQQHFVEFLVGSFNRLYAQCVGPLAVAHTPEEAYKALGDGRTSSHGYRKYSELLVLQAPCLPSPSPVPADLGSAIE
jgi:hypothetical protein